MAGLRLAAIGVDLDGIGCYRAIHGLAARDGPDPVHQRAVERFGNLLADLGLGATFFAVGADLEDAEAAGRLRRLADAGHEVASHSFEHDYYLAAYPAVRIARDLTAAHRAIESAIGRAPRGFRAPGYTLSAPLVAAALELGYRYDSSLLPCPLYGAAKNQIRRIYRLLGRESRTLSARWRALLGPRAPYRMRPPHYWAPAGEGLVELPIGVAPISGLPLLGTLISLLPEPVTRGLVLAPALARLPLVNLELHGLDLVDGNDPGVEPALIAAQPDLRVPLTRRLARLAAALRRVAAEREVVTLDAAAKRY